MNTILRYLPIALLALAWEFVSYQEIVDPSSLPPLSAVVRAWWKLMISGDILRHGLSSLVVLLSGLSIAIVVGTVLGVSMAWSNLTEDIASPIVKSLYPMPKSALIPVMVMWFGFGSMSKITLIFLGCLLPIVSNAFNGARGVDQTLIWSAYAAGAQRWQVLRDVVVPGAAPDILSGIRTALGISFILLVSSEMLIGQHGLGFLISFLGDGGSYDGMFAAVLTVSAAGFIADRGYLMLTRRVLSWRE